MGSGSSSLKRNHVAKLDTNYKLFWIILIFLGIEFFLDIESISLHSNMCIVCFAEIISFETACLILENFIVLNSDVLLTLAGEEENPVLELGLAGPSQELGKAFSSLFSFFQVISSYSIICFLGSSKNSVTSCMPYTFFHAFAWVISLTESLTAFPL